VLAVALVVAIGLGVGLGSLIAPSGTAAPGPIGTGFLPGPGWTVLQTGEDATPERQALAVASNVTLHPEDDARGIRGSSGLPYSTLLGLPSTGVVIVALFTRRESEPWNDEYFPKRELPLRVRDALGSLSHSFQVRPERPLGQYELPATIGGHHVSVHFYFGIQHPSPHLIAAAQQQLDRLVVATMSAERAVARRSNSAVETSALQAPTRIIDRTLVCSVADGNPREIQVQALSGTRLFGDRSKWKLRPHGAFHDPRAASPAGSQTSAWVTAGWPPHEEIGRPPSAVSLAYSRRCRPSGSRVPLSRAGLSGGAASPNGDEYDCIVPGRILVRIKAIFRAPASLSRYRFGQLAARGAVQEGYLAIRSQSGKQIALATVHESGKARLFVGSTCGPSG
jgi:hypothetical protein